MERPNNTSSWRVEDRRIQHNNRARRQPLSSHMARERLFEQAAKTIAERAARRKARLIKRDKEVRIRVTIILVLKMLGIHGGLHSIRGLICHMYAPRPIAPRPIGTRGNPIVLSFGSKDNPIVLYTGTEDNPIQYVNC